MNVTKCLLDQNMNQKFHKLNKNISMRYKVLRNITNTQHIIINVNYK